MSETEENDEGSWPYYLKWEYRDEELRFETLEKAKQELEVIWILHHVIGDVHESLSLYHAPTGRLIAIVEGDGWKTGPAFMEFPKAVKAEEAQSQKPESKQQ